MSTGPRQPGVQRQVNIGPYIMGAAAIHSLILVAGMFAFVEYQKAQVAGAIHEAEVRRLERQAEAIPKPSIKTQPKREYDEPADRRGQ